MRGGVCRLELKLALASAVILRSESRGTQYHILLSQIRDSPNLESQVPVFISPRNRVAQLYPQALGSLCVASYVSLGYGGGIQPCLHTGFLCFTDCSSFRSPVYSLGADRIQSTASNSSSIVACFCSNNSTTVASLSVAAEMCLESHCLATAVSSGSAIPAFGRHVTILICQLSINHSDSVEDMEISPDCILTVHYHVHYFISHCIKLPRLIQRVTFGFSSLECVYVLYFTHDHFLSHLSKFIIYIHPPT
jgi:hypothetical protein